MQIFALKWNIFYFVKVQEKCNIPKNKCTRKMIFFLLTSNTIENNYIREQNILARGTKYLLSHRPNFFFFENNFFISTWLKKTKLFRSIGPGPVTDTFWVLLYYILMRKKMTNGADNYSPKSFDKCPKKIWQWGQTKTKFIKWYFFCLVLSAPFFDLWDIFKKELDCTHISFFFCL
jgi:hypothetical protein